MGEERERSKEFGCYLALEEVGESQGKGLTKSFLYYYLRVVLRSWVER